MDSPVMPIQRDPVALPEAPKSRDVAPGKKRDDQDETRDTAAAAAALTVSFAEILQSKRQDLKIGTEAQATKEPAMKTKHTGLKQGGEALLLVNGQLAADKKPVKQPFAEVQAKEMLENAKELAGAAMKAGTKKELNGDSQQAVQSAELTKKGALNPAEEALLKEMIQKNGNLAVQKKAAQVTGFVNGEPLTRREGIGAVKSMMAKEGEVLKNLSGGDDAQRPQKPKSGKSGKAQQAFILRDVPEGEGKEFQSISSADKVKQEFATLMENTQDKLTSAGQAKKQGTPGGTNPEIRDVPAGAGTISVLPGRGLDSAAPARPQAVMSQVLDGATQILREGSGRVTMTLQPPRLGTLDLDVVVQDNRVKMVMLADNQEVKQMLQAGMDDLRNALQDKGFQIDRLEVLVQNRPDDAGSNFWQEAGFGREDSAGREERKREKESVHAAQGSPARPLRTGDSGISIFA
jgi:flagellar hook-length control protein FliK